VVRVSCLDCLSRTNLMLSALALHGAAGQLRELCGALVGGAAEAVARACEPPLLAALQRLWAEAGDAISMQYAGAPRDHLGKGRGLLSSIQRRGSFVVPGPRVLSLFCGRGLIYCSEAGGLFLFRSP
jgi:phosphatidylinositol-bisphosphatase